MLCWLSQTIKYTEISRYISVGKTTTQAKSYVGDSAVLRQMNIFRLLKGGEDISRRYGPGSFYWTSFLPRVILHSRFIYVLMTVAGQDHNKHTWYHTTMHNTLLLLLLILIRLISFVQRPSGDCAITTAEKSSRLKSPARLVLSVVTHRTHECEWQPLLHQQIGFVTYVFINSQLSGF